MKRMMACAGMLLVVAVFADAVSARAQQTPQQLCPPGYSRIGEVCISDKTGDIVLPRKEK